MKREVVETLTFSYDELKLEVAKAIQMSYKVEILSVTHLEDRVVVHARPLDPNKVNVVHPGVDLLTPPKKVIEEAISSRKGSRGPRSESVSHIVVEQFKYSDRITIEELLREVTKTHPDYDLKRLKSNLYPIKSLVQVEPGVYMLKEVFQKIHGKGETIMQAS